MPTHTLMAYNIEQINKIFEGNAVKPEEQQRAQDIAAVIQGNKTISNIYEKTEEHRKLLSSPI